MVKIFYVTAFFDIGRDSWKSFGRTFEQYLEEFSPIIDLFKKEDPAKHHLTVYIDSRHAAKLTHLSEIKNCNVFSIDEDWLHKNTMWKTLKREEEIMASERFKSLLGHRIRFPEAWNPKYTLINHIKVDFLAHTYVSLVKDDLDYICWIDFGFFKKDNLRKSQIFHPPPRLLDYKHFKEDKVNCTSLSPILDSDLDIEYTLKHAPERVTGYFFILRCDLILKYQDLYHRVLEDFQAQGYADDDQHLVLRCYKENPAFFYFHQMPWHSSFWFFRSLEDRETDARKA